MGESVKRRLTYKDATYLEKLEKNTLRPPHVRFPLDNWQVSGEGRTLQVHRKEIMTNRQINRDELSGPLSLKARKQDKILS